MVADRVRNRPKDLVRFEIAADRSARSDCSRCRSRTTSARHISMSVCDRRRVMHVAPGKIAEHFFRFLIEAVTGPRIRREDGNGYDVPQRRNPRHEDLAGMSAGIKEIVFILLAGRDVTGERVRRPIRRGSAALFSATRQANHERD